MNKARRQVATYGRVSMAFRQKWYKRKCAEEWDLMVIPTDNFPR